MYRFEPSLRFSDVGISKIIGQYSEYVFDERKEAYVNDTIANELHYLAIKPSLLLDKQFSDNEKLFETSFCAKFDFNGDFYDILLKITYSFVQNDLEPYYKVTFDFFQPESKKEIVSLDTRLDESLISGIMSCSQEKAFSQISGIFSKENKFNEYVVPYFNLIKKG